MYTYIALDSLLLSGESHHWDRFVIYSLLQSQGSHLWGTFAFQLISNLRVPLLGQVCYCYAGSPRWNWVIYATVGKVLVFCCTGYNLMQPGRMLSCTHQNCIIGVESLQNSFWHLLYPKFTTSSRNG